MKKYLLLCEAYLINKNGTYQDKLVTTRIQKAVEIRNEFFSLFTSTESKQFVASILQPVLDDKNDYIRFIGLTTVFLLVKENYTNFFYFGKMVLSLTEHEFVLKTQHKESVGASCCLLVWAYLVRKQNKNFVMGLEKRQIDAETTIRLYELIITFCAHLMFESNFSRTEMESVDYLKETLELVLCEIPSDNITLLIEKHKMFLSDCSVAKRWSAVFSLSNLLLHQYNKDNVLFYVILLGNCIFDKESTIQKEALYGINRVIKRRVDLEDSDFVVSLVLNVVNKWKEIGDESILFFLKSVVPVFTSNRVTPSDFVVLKIVQVVLTIFFHTTSEKLIVDCTTLVFEIIKKLDTKYAKVIYLQLIEGLLLNKVNVLKLAIMLFRNCIYKMGEVVEEENVIQLTIKRIKFLWNVIPDQIALLMGVFLMYYKSEKCVSFELQNSLCDPLSRHIWKPFVLYNKCKNEFWLHIVIGRNI
ncbi:hypothetical protein EIN_505550 [Entamoeba invadens IP1]|uniref:Uncharacterized protein n=1 Tax=Entamoeba invadens IP1 TaxID=370355 RepID=A0A0A1U7J9_ENTIV|nr:hypothetical protein EIN_505550 [Entamoeba invadens IP1]ELP90319.1 hypothetical protein EIN_505550 [Entamoeba invadens IP1]|eukprot:XP_004257090.1 hypothetical protein EIN_505550 [Entamoeba invadens IP1]